MPMIRAFFGLDCFPFKKDISEIFLSRQLNYLEKRTSHFIDTVKSRIIIPRESRSKIPLSDSGFSL